MTLEFDHAAICAETLEEGVAFVEDTLGVSMDAGGCHPGMGTHNKLLSLGGTAYLEVIAIDPELPDPLVPRWFGLDDFKGPPRLAGWVARADDFDRIAQSPPFEMSKPMRMSRGDLNWDLLRSEVTPTSFDGLTPSIIDWKEGKHPCQRLTDKGVRMSALTVSHPRISQMVAGFPCLFSLADVRFEAAPTEGLMLDVETPSGARRLA